MLFSCRLCIMLNENGCAVSIIRYNGKGWVSVVKKATRNTSIPAKRIVAGRRPRKKVIAAGRAAEPLAVPSVITQTYLSDEELQHFRAMLIEKLKQLAGDVLHLEDGALRKSRQDATGDLSSMPIHMADIGSDIYEQELSLNLMDSERKTVQEILAALKRIDCGVYGMCEGTGEPIPKARLEAFPWARYCVGYAEKIENNRLPQ